MKKFIRHLTLWWGGIGHVSYLTFDQSVHCPIASSLSFFLCFVLSMTCGSSRHCLLAFFALAF